MLDVVKGVASKPTVDEFKDALGMLWEHALSQTLASTYICLGGTMYSENW
jgi:hypothetical protein